MICNAYHSPIVRSRGVGAIAVNAASGARAVNLRRHLRTYLRSCQIDCYEHGNRPRYLVHWITAWMAGDPYCALAHWNVSEDSRRGYRFVVFSLELAQLLILACKLSPKPLYVFLYWCSKSHNLLSMQMYLYQNFSLNPNQ